MAATFAASNNNLNIAPLSFVAEEAITANRALKLGSVEGQVLHTTAITEACIGVALQTVAAGQEVPVQIFGVVKCVASAAVSMGAELMPTAAGAGKVMTAAGATARGMGFALQDAAGDGSIFSVLLAGPQAKSAAHS